jgi:hypothetical protein
VLDLNECKLQCDLFASFGACDWFLFVEAGQDENCHLFGPGLETMDDYLSSCNIRGQPMRRKDDTCILDPLSNTGKVICANSDYCPNAVPCAPCDNKDNCEGYVETGCTMTTEGVEQIGAADTPEGCQAFAIGIGRDELVTYATFNMQAEECRTYATGARTCNYKVARQTVDMDVIIDCKDTGESP